MKNVPNHQPENHGNCERPIPSRSHQDLHLFSIDVVICFQPHIPAHQLLLKIIEIIDSIWIIQNHHRSVEMISKSSIYSHHKHIHYMIVEIIELEIISTNSQPTTNSAAMEIIDSWLYWDGLWIFPL